MRPGRASGVHVLRLRCKSWCARVHPGTVKDLAAKPSSVPSRTVFARTTCAVSYRARDGVSRLDLAERPEHMDTPGNFGVRDE